jgi:hypothetical protein
MNETQDRFEKWAMEQGFDTRKNDEGGYAVNTTDAMYGGWIAAERDAEKRHSRICIEWAKICDSGRRHGAKVGAQECANLIRGWNGVYGG